MNVHMIDSELFKDLYGNDEIRNIFSDKNLLKKWITVEVALAKAQAELGIIPYEAFEEIERKGKTELFEMQEIRKGIEHTTHPLVTFLKIYQNNCHNDLGEYIHYGATTQDIIDTALILQLKDGYEIISKQISEFNNVLAEQTEKYRDTPMAGRTHGQHALPITFGFKLATWLSEMDRHKERLEALKDRVFVGQFGGAVGTLSSLENFGSEIQKRMLEILDLKIPDITWHTSRDNFVELASVYAMISGTVGKIANEIINLQRTEIAEMDEGFVHGNVGSSTMPHKRNPMQCEYIVGLSRLIRMQLPSVYDTLVQEHERDMGLWLVEWEVFPEISIYLSKMVEQMTSIMKNMTVNTKKMRENIDITGGLILSEKIMFILSPYIGKQTAHDLVYDACMSSYENNVPIIEELMKNPIISKHISVQELENALDPQNYLGLSTGFVDNVLNKSKVKNA